MRSCTAADAGGGTLRTLREQPDIIRAARAPGIHCESNRAGFLLAILDASLARILLELLGVGSDSSQPPRSRTASPRTEPQRDRAGPTMQPVSSVKALKLRLNRGH